MGTGMAHNLVRAGFETSVYNRTRAKAETIQGARVANSPADACRDADVVMTMLADDHATEDMVFASDGVAAGLREGCIHISHSTISTALSRKLASEHAARKQRYLSVPVFGRPEAAEAKRLIVVAAGDADAIDRVRPLFDAIGRATFVVGAEPWQANAVKLCGNFMLASMLETFGEAFATTRKAGVAPQQFLEIMNTLFGSPVYQGYGGAIANEKFEPAGFRLALGLKDITLALETATASSMPMPLASFLRYRWLSAVTKGRENMDWSAVALGIAEEAGLK